ncbi:hypothetical protein RUND412_011043 [Rhizina undulata]
MSQHSRTRSTPVSFQTFNDMDFIDYDAADSILPNSPELPTQTSLPSSSSQQPTRVATAAVAPSNMNPKTTTMSTQATGFPAPSHQYDLHPQQTGLLPVNGGYFNDSFFIPPSTPMLSADNASFMQLDSDASSSPSTVNTSIPAYFYPDTTENATQNFVNPSTILGSFDDFEFKSDSVSMPTPAAPVQSTAPMSTAGRYYAGIHQHQAAYQQQQKALMQQRQNQANQTARQIANNPVSSASPTEERINRILDSMKSTIPPPDSAQQNAVLPHIAKMKKEEDEMDEDERLLASDAGKKLTSKERRQLRNKVSARAFRSRRKEYISQLEHEVANKSNEVQAYQYENSRLKDENAKLSDFLRMVLATPAFSTFLDGIPIPLPENNTASPPEVVSSAPEVRNFNDNIRANTRKDRNPNLGSVAEDGDWPLAYPQWGQATSQVYAVFDLPQPNIQDLSGKLIDEDEEDAEWKMLSMPPVADGFFPMRDEKARINFDDYDDDEYEAPENLADVYEEEFGVSYLKVEEENECLDALFPGTGVTGLLDDLEKIASGEAKVEELFDVEMDLDSNEEKKSLTTKEIERKEALGRADRMLAGVEGVYRRVGLLVGS